jgi:protein-L-isoaspartate(D-aspartate) O-methyltransferase
MFEKMRILNAAFVILLTAFSCAQESETDILAHRTKMVERQIVNRGVTNTKVLKAILAVPRHKFVPKEYKKNAYDDTPLPIGYDQTISQPYIVAYMTDILDLDSSHSVLEIGTGSGYQAAVLSVLAKEVFTIEIVPELGENAAAILEQLGYENVKVNIGDGYQGWPEKAPFDRIIVTAAPEKIPEKLVDQLKPDGIMVLPTGPQWWNQELKVVKKHKDGTFSEESKLPVRFVPMVHPKE